jgi:exonuclease SbcC
VLITRLYLRNFRVYEDELDLPLPPGLVGIYGPNGAGKSTLLEAILWTLWGKARTTKDLIRSAGVGGDCVTEVEFEHEGHLYLVRRTLSGINAMPRLEARCDGLVMSEGVRDAARYIESVLGMDDGSFRASVFAEQRQLAAFSDRSPADRLRLVLRLLGITPLDGARDAARKEARLTSAGHDQARRMLPDVEVLRVDTADAEARAAAVSVQADAAQQAAAAAQERLQAAAADMAALDRRRQEYDTLVVEGRHARQELDAVAQTVTESQTELDALRAAADELAGLEQAALGLDANERLLEALAAAASAATEAARVAVPAEPAVVDDARVETARAEAVATGQRSAGLEALAQAAAADLDRAQQAAARSATLDGAADCPVCGQALGDAFEQVQAHRAAELAEARSRRAGLTEQVTQARRLARAAETHRAETAAAAETARAARSQWEQADRRHQELVAAARQAWAGVVALAPARGDSTGPSTAPGETGPAAAALARQVADLRAGLDRQRAAQVSAERLRVRLERRPALEAALATQQERLALAADRVQTLRDKVRALAFDTGALDRAAAVHADALDASHTAGRQAHDAAIAAAGERAKHEAAATRLEDAEQQHAKLAQLESDARHLSRVADLLADFRNTVVASVGPRLAVQAAELFAELTDHDYDELQVDPETYELQISDAGKVYGLDRFSGSEIDLANLALRVAISEHIHFQSGGSVGLLVLDEVFGPLDEDRKARMLLALERLRGRFRQVLVVTHDSSIKEQLPNAIEVVKLPGRRATARPVGG